MRRFRSVGSIKRSRQSRSNQKKVSRAGRHEHARTWLRVACAGWLLSLTAPRPGSSRSRSVIDIPAAQYRKDSRMQVSSRFIKHCSSMSLSVTLPGVRRARNGLRRWPDQAQPCCSLLHGSNILDECCRSWYHAKVDPTAWIGGCYEKLSEAETRLSARAACKADTSLWHQLPKTQLSRCNWVPATRALHCHNLQST